jgi:RNA polymerase sigma factor (sigma-70 family)
MSYESFTDEVTELVGSYEEQLLRYATRLLQDCDLAQDTVQEAFVRYMRFRSRSGNPIDNPKAWLYRVCHNLALDHIRKDQRQVGFREELYHKDCDKHESGPYNKVARRDAEAAAWELLSGLPEREQRIVTLKVVDNKSYKEIAEIMDITTSNVGFILHSTMKKLGRDMKNRLSMEM